MCAIISFIFFVSFSAVAVIDGELEAEWLVAAGFPQLTKAFEEVCVHGILFRLINRDRSVVITKSHTCYAMHTQNNSCEKLWTSVGVDWQHAATFYWEKLWVVKQFDHWYLQGRELSTSELKSSVAGLPRSHAEAVKQRVKALNRTVRGRTRSRHSRKPDIRDVFRDVDTSSTGTRSRSATPDSLDSVPADTDHWTSHNQMFAIRIGPNQFLLIKVSFTDRISFPFSTTPHLP